MVTFQAAGATVLLAYLPHSRSWQWNLRQSRVATDMYPESPVSPQKKKKSPETKRWFLDRL